MRTRVNWTAAVFAVVATSCSLQAGEELARPQLPYVGMPMTAHPYGYGMHHGLPTYNQYIKDVQVARLYPIAYQDWLKHRDALLVQQNPAEYYAQAHQMPQLRLREMGYGLRDRLRGAADAVNSGVQAGHTDIFSWMGSKLARRRGGCGLFGCKKFGHRRGCDAAGCADGGCASDAVSTTVPNATYPAPDSSPAPKELPIAPNAHGVPLAPPVETPKAPVIETPMAQPLPIESAEPALPVAPVAPEIEMAIPTAPAVELPTPMAEPAAPVIEQPKPVIETPAPAIETPESSTIPILPANPIDE